MTARSAHAPHVGHLYAGAVDALRRTPLLHSQLESVFSSPLRFAHWTKLRRHRLPRRVRHDGTDTTDPWAADREELRASAEANEGCESRLGIWKEMVRADD